MKRLFIIFILIAISYNVQSQNADQYKELMSQDWAFLKRYRVENDSVIKSGNLPEVVFMGNSITEGWYMMHPDFFKQNNFLGRGISGQTTPQMLIRFLADVIDLKPKVVVILAGTNDIAGNTGYSSVKMITDNLKAMAILAAQNNIKVIISSILPVSDYPWRPGLNPAEKVAEVNKWAQDYCEQNGYIYLDYFTPMVNEQRGMKTEYAQDGVHPTEEGYNVMEPLVIKAIKSILSEK